MTFNDDVGRLLSEFFAHYPVHATEAGNHEHDGEWPDLTDDGRRARLAWIGDATARLEGIDEAGLSRDEAIDREILLDELAQLRFDEETLDEEHWSPITYTYLFGGGLFGLLSREFAPLPDRLRSVAQRLRGLPAALDAARANLEQPGGRPVSGFHTEKAIQTIPGVADLARTAVEEAEKVDDEALRVEVRAAADEAIAAADVFTTWLRDQLLPAATGDFRLGADLYAEKFGHRLRSTFSPEELEQRAETAFHEVRAEMARLARELWPAWLGSEPIPSDPDAMTRRVLDEIATDHPAATELLDFCREENERIEAFIRENGLIGLAEEPLDIIWTPQFLRAFGGAMLMSPGPLDKGLKSFFAITPPPDDWNDAQVDSMLREDNRRMLRLLTIHEAVPGHYLQLAYANRCPSVVRAIFASGVFAEGWAVYVTQVMMDVGYGADDLALILVHWKFYLRAITNTLMDIGIHAGSMTEEEAMTLMVDKGFQERSEAAEKWSRARLSSTQLCSYFLGGLEMTELEREARRRASGQGGAFSWRPFLESVLAHGTPPMPVIRDILYGD